MLTRMTIRSVLVFAVWNLAAVQKNDTDASKDSQ